MRALSSSPSNLARLAATLTLVAAAACSKTSESTAPAPSATQPTPTATQPPATATTTTPAATTAAAVPAGPPGTIEGVVKFTGTAPAPKPIEKVSDPVCSAAKPMDNAVVVKNGGLGGVLVRIELGGAHGEATGTPQLKQEGCMYVPRVLGAVAGQDIEIVNADKTMHNVHTYKGQETVLNAGQPAGAQPLKRPASDEAAILKVKCDVHPWMTAYIVVTDHPFFAVTDDSGAFKIPNVPAGKYKVEAWHPEFGMMTKDVEVVGGKPVDPGFSYTGTEKKPE